MIYFETNQPHFVVWPYLAIGIYEELWIGIGWLNLVGVTVMVVLGMKPNSRGRIHD